jgi:hypothetical protein
MRRKEERMRKRRISYLGALGLALAVAIPGTASAAGTQKVEAGFVEEFNGTVPIPPPVLDLGKGYTKGGTLYTRLFLDGYGSPVPEAAVFDIHAPDELRFNTKGLAQCDPEQIRGRSDEEAAQICSKALIGQGSASAFLADEVPPLVGGTTLFNGTKQNGNSTVLFHSTAGTPVTLVSEMLNSPLPDFGTLFRTPVAQSAGGGVPDGIPIVDTAFTISKKYTDKKLKKKAKKTKMKAKKASGKKAKKLKKKARKLNKKSKKSWVQAKCTDGVAPTRVEVSYTDGSRQSAETTPQECVKK